MAWDASEAGPNMNEYDDPQPAGGDSRDLPFTQPENLTGIETAMVLATAFGGAGPKVIENLSKKPEVIATIAPVSVRLEAETGRWIWQVDFRSNIPAAMHLVKMECVQKGVSLSLSQSSSSFGYRSETSVVHPESPFVIPGHDEKSLFVEASGIGNKHAIDVGYFLLPLSFPKALKIESALAIPANWKA